MPRLVRATATVVAVATAMPLLYLVVRAVGAPADRWALLWSTSTLLLGLRTVGLAVAVTLTAVAIGVPLAWLLARTDLPGRRWWAILLPLPLAVPSYLGAYAWIALFAPGGLAEKSVGASPLPAYGFLGAWFSLSLLTYPYVLLPVQASLMRMDPRLEEAARSLGCTPWRARWRVVWPALRPAVDSGAQLVFLYTLSDFGAVSLLRYNTFTRVLYVQFESTIDRSGTAVLALGFMLLAVCAVVALRWLAPARDAGVQRATVNASRLPLGAGRFAGLAFVVIVLLLALVAPAMTIVYWSWFGTAQWSMDLVVRWVSDGYRSFTVAIAAAGLGTIAALPIAWWRSRTSGAFASRVYGLAHASFTLPGLVLALSLVFLGVQAAPWLYQTWAMLVLAYALRFLPQAMAAQRGVMTRIEPSLLEAARTLRAGTGRTLRRVLLPLAQPGLLSGALLVFLTAMKELPCALLLAPLDFSTLATEVWSQASEAAFSDAAPGALLLLLISAGPLAWQRWRLESSP